ncbi:MAG: hypothetical protein ACTSYS_14135 [Promethearchaeota archaeon]
MTLLRFFGTWPDMIEELFYKSSSTTLIPFSKLLILIIIPSI